ncbi:MAG TPA: EAL domain-containing protein [Candidatus Acidoferrum sp.]|nr:EAL domain-containing protein [Candidatus Acidoferrum sp.]
MTTLSDLSNEFSATPEILVYALESANDAVYIYDEHRRIIYANARASQMTGYSQDELLGMTIFDLVPGYPLSDQDTVRQRAEQRTRLLLESAHRHKNGNDVPVEVSLAVTMFAGSVFTIAFVRDISRRKVRQREQEQFRQIIDTSPVALLICDRDSGIVKYANTLAQRLFEELQQADISMELVRLFAEHGIGEDLCRRLLSGEEFQNQELQLVIRDELTWLSLNTRNMLLDGRESVCLAMTDVTEAHELSNQLSYQATYDDLTGLLNRREFEDRLQEVIDIGPQRSANTVCYLDLDQFKVINDSCGHMAGDEMLRQIARELTGCVRKDDTLARLGGDEFAILLENCSLVNAERIANKVCNTVQEFRFVWQNNVFTVGVSIGLTQINDDGETLTEVMRRADAACYAAKEGGRNRVQIFTHGDEGLTWRHNQMQWVSRLNAALDLGNFELWAQEIGEINHTNDMLSRSAGSHFEVLLRLRTIDGELVQPGDFLPAAERYDLAPKIDRWVLRKLFEWLASHPEECAHISLCAINVSGQTLNDIYFQREVVTMLETSKLPADRLCFEVTETSAIANLASTSAFMRRLKLHGCTFALDDFGRGLSSFAYLKSLPVDFVKIDGFFVKDILSDPVDRAMVKAIIDMGHALGKKTIAEFVENEAILAELIELNIDYVQGYGIAKPVRLA